MAAIAAPRILPWSLVLVMVLLLVAMQVSGSGSGSILGGHGRELSGKPTNCPKACAVRCQTSHWTRKRCMKNCNICCRDCSCVPSRHKPKSRKGHFVENCSCYKGMGHFCP
ncbi:hypothetical protein SELMODRAFT_410628 [Selaginella moellendorffii]|uniref:Uncharacterized protein n=1 Tax=Selaginella moellendorffii TaxID=88036 RepID=D8RFC4_SELML|nr:gibberellin-regulated protein 8 [Selaginella moellendorffii]XP_002981328.1 gibberellin-regulated protein 8 [Selaginella moellendorffii]EFJ17516.1 hypothetical protein SELMODRAFT_420906 [Selaginella moellendorffii]EFJ28846.1 hypothetical protein SELMODRAFT_410628 [Selaginella moellendorffii]|eukprot:XP_002969722.1 gibberellin-regulated protein 8 [Selaginella moellendorffii]